MNLRYEHTREIRTEIVTAIDENEPTTLNVISDNVDVCETAVKKHLADLKAKDEVGTQPCMSDPRATEYYLL